MVVQAEKCKNSWRDPAIRWLNLSLCPLLNLNCSRHIYLLHWIRKFLRTELVITHFCIFSSCNHARHRVGFWREIMLNLLLLSASPYFLLRKKRKNCVLMLVLFWHMSAFCSQVPSFSNIEQLLAHGQESYYQDPLWFLSLFLPCKWISKALLTKDSKLILECTGLLILCGSLRMPGWWYRSTMPSWPQIASGPSEWARGLLSCLFALLPLSLSSITTNIDKVLR